MDPERALLEELFPGREVGVGIAGGEVSLVAGAAGVDDAGGLDLREAGVREELGPGGLGEDLEGESKGASPVVGGGTLLVTVNDDVGGAAF